MSIRNSLSSDPQATVNSPMLDVTVVIVSYNTAKLTLDCLRSIYEQTRRVSFEVVVIDNASSDGSVAAIHQEFPECIVIENVKNLGFAAANNQGLCRARGRYALLLNSDTRVLDGAIDKAVAFADVHPESGMVGCRTLSANGSIQYNCFMFPSLLNLALSLTQLTSLRPRNRFFGRARMTWWNYDTVREVDAVAGCFMLVRRQAFEEVGPMSEEYFMYSEDTDWCWRFSRKGWKVLYTPDAVIVHIREASASQFAVDMHLLQRRSILMFLEKKSGALVRWTANAMFCVSALSRLFVLSLGRVYKGSYRQETRRQWDISVASLWFHLWGYWPKSVPGNPSGKVGDPVCEGE